MHVSLTSIGLVGVALFAGCSQPMTPTSPTSLSSASLSIASSEANATGARVLLNDKQVPFKGRLEGTATITPGTPPFLSVLIEGTGNATHLGRFIIEIPHAVNTTNRTSIGTYEFTAANGDTLTAGFTGQSTLTAPGVLSIVETATITGGTGSIRLRHWELYRRALVQPGNRRDHGFLRRDYPLALIVPIVRALSAFGES